jgi:Asp-tRNA(Asn)/Glu-tRNA(Gln) amidotransferase A subunit family amidase
MGLTSRAGVFPLNLQADIAGPMARTLEDAVRVLEVVAGPDPRDPATAAAADHPHPDYLKSLNPLGLKGLRIGVLREAYERPTADPEVLATFNAALEQMRGAGAVIVDPAPVAGLPERKRDEAQGRCMGFKYDLERFLAARAGEIPAADLAAVIASGKFHPSVQRSLEEAEKTVVNGPESAACLADAAYREAFRKAVLETMDRLRIDAYVYPTWSNPPRLIGDLNSPGGDNSQIFSPTTGFPAINVPMGYTRGGVLPVGVTFFGRPWSEPDLIRAAYGYEQASIKRRPPTSTPPLRETAAPPP